jgi:hypothetical protein
MFQRYGVESGVERWGCKELCSISGHAASLSLVTGSCKQREGSQSRQLWTQATACSGDKCFGEIQVCNARLATRSDKVVVSFILCVQLSYISKPIKGLLCISNL